MRHTSLSDDWHGMLTKISYLLQQTILYSRLASSTQAIYRMIFQKTYYFIPHLYSFSMASDISLHSIVFGPSCTGTGGSLLVGGTAGMLV